MSYKTLSTLWDLGGFLLVFFEIGVSSRCMYVCLSIGLSALCMRHLIQVLRFFMTPTCCRVLICVVVFIWCTASNEHYMTSENPDLIGWPVCVNVIWDHLGYDDVDDDYSLAASKVINSAKIDSSFAKDLFRLPLPSELETNTHHTWAVISLKHLLCSLGVFYLFVFLLKINPLATYWLLSTKTCIHTSIHTAVAIFVFVTPTKK